MGRRGVACAIAIALGIVPGVSQDHAVAESYEFGPSVTQLGPEETVFDHNHPDGILADACESTTLPDLPARAFRDHTGRVQLLLSHYTTHRMVGRDLDDLAVDCDPVMRSQQRNDPSSFDNWTWIAAPYTTDGRRVYALGHDEFHGWDSVPANCPNSYYTAPCWYNGITLVKSGTRGDSWVHAVAPTHLVASLPYRYEPPAPGGPPAQAVGYFEPSNIVKRSDGYYYAMFQANAYRSQRWGACVMRTQNLADPRSWRAWGDGTDGDAVSSFEVTLVNPYTYVFSTDDPPEKHLCETVSNANINAMHSGLTWNSHFGKYLLIGNGHTASGAATGNPWDVYYSTSDDLVNWSPRQLLMKAEFIFEQCSPTDPNPILYPTVLDPASTARNFDTSGRRVYLYFKRFNNPSPRPCNGTSWPAPLDRDLIRIPFEFSQ